MKNLTDRDYLLRQQYRDPANLLARVALHKHFSTNPEGVPRWFLRQLHLPEDARVLEVGCGPGGYWLEAADLIPPSWRITLSDFSPGMVAQARERVAALDRSFTVVQADAQDLPFPNSSFDAVIANFMLYHVPDRPRALAEIHRVLAAGGRLYAMTNGRKHMREYLDLVNRAAPGLLRGEESDFSLENGAAQFAPWFDQIELIRYPNTLLVTEAEPLLAYTRSQAAGLTADQERALRKGIEAELAARGAVTVTPDAGLFTAIKR